MKLYAWICLVLVSLLTLMGCAGNNSNSNSTQAVAPNTYQVGPTIYDADFNRDVAEVDAREGGGGHHGR